MSSSPTPASVQLVLSAPDESAETQASVERVRGWLLLRLIEEGYMVTTTDAEAGIRLSVVLSDGQWVLQAAGQEVRSDVVAGGSNGIGSLKMIHRALALLALVAPRAGVAAPERVVDAPTSREGPEGGAADAALESSPAAAEPVPTAEATPAEPLDPRRFWGHLGLGWEHRTGGSDPFLRAQIDWMREHGLGFRLQSDLLQSGPPALDIVEVEAQGGVTLDFELGRGTAVVVSALAGARFHRYSFETNNTDLRIGPIASLPVELVLHGSSLRFALGGGLTAATRPTEHTFGGRSMWQRGALGYGLFLTLGASP